MRRYRLAVLGGTFDHLHIGHEALLTTAFQVGDEVAIGLTTDRFVSRSPKPTVARVQPYSVRRSALARWIRRNFPHRKWRVVPLEDSFGRSVGPDVDALVVSRETLSGGRAVNRERRRRGRRPIPLVVVPIVLAEDLEPVSSRRVRSGAIGEDGRRRSPIRVQVVTQNTTDRAPAVRAIRRVFPEARVSRSDGKRLRNSPELTVLVRRRSAGGWTVVERSPHVRLPPRRVEGRRPADLERGVVALLRPPKERKLFGTRGASRR